ncbi:MAG: nuclear export factor GLE1, partial [Mycobacterium sp.]
EPEHPAPTLALAAGPTPQPTQHIIPTSSARPTATAPPPAQQPRTPADNTARVLGGAALLVGALGIGAALVVRRT